ncbi:NAD(P)/FAD-dependent oxidoreductase [Chloroflexota bacterium]
MVVIGGGPAGSQVAYKLAGMGHRTVVIEQKKSLGEAVCCTGIIGQECIRSFGIDESAIFRWANSARIFSPSGKLLHVWRQEPQACILDRAAFNTTLANRAQDKGAKYILNSTVSNIEVRDDRVRIETDRQAAEQNAYEARAVVIATGFGSKLVGELGLGKVGDFVMGAQAEVETTGVDEVEVYSGHEVAPAFFAWLVPTSPQKGLAGLLSRRSPSLYLKKLLSSLLAQGKIASDTVKIKHGGIPLKPPARTFGERLLVVGSAAGQVKPTTGGGVYYSLLGADIAANNLHQALKNDVLSADSLANYEKEWKKKLGRELRLGYWARKFYELLNDRQIDGIFDLIKSNGIDEALLKSEDLSFDWHSGVVLRLIGQQAFSKAARAMKIPLPLKGQGVSDSFTGGVPIDE